MEIFGLFKFKVFFDENWDGWLFKVYDKTDKEMIESSEVFSSEGIARYAAIGQIALLELKQAFSQCTFERS